MRLGREIFRTWLLFLPLFYFPRTSFFLYLITYTQVIEYLRFLNFDMSISRPFSSFWSHLVRATAHGLRMAPCGARALSPSYPGSPYTLPPNPSGFSYGHHGVSHLSHRAGAPTRALAHTARLRAARGCYLHSAPTHPTLFPPKP